ncbi:MAG: secretin N-terminal domain-containing protein [Planctomycetota bacterium]
MRATAFWMTFLTALLLLGLCLGCASSEEEELAEAVAAETSVTETIVLENARAADVAIDLRALLANPQVPEVVADERANVLYVTGIPSEIERVRGMVQQLDVQDGS